MGVLFNVQSLVAFRPVVEAQNASWRKNQVQYIIVISRVASAQSTVKKIQYITLEQTKLYRHYSFDTKSDNDKDISKMISLDNDIESIRGFGPGCGQSPVYWQ